MMQKAEKQELLLLANLFREHVSRHYGISDDDEPIIMIEAAHHCEGYYSTRENKIVLRPSRISTDLICHEMAHWVQYTLRGATDCYSTPVMKRNFTLAHDHALLQKNIYTLMHEKGYVKAFLNVLG